VGEDRSFRERLQGDLDARYEALLGVVDDALASKTLVWVSCPHCRKRSQVEVQDTRAALAAAEFVSNQSHGRPGVDERAGEESEPLIFVRCVNDHDAQRIFDAARLFVPAEKFEEFARAASFQPGSPQEQS
jgi:hypothetical protein